MREQPGHIDQRELARTLHEQWGLAPGRLRHLPVGFGDHHWELTDAVGGGWFITVAELAGGRRGTGPAAGYADLRAAMETVTALRRAGLEFAIAPVPTASGQALAPLDDGHAITVFPYVDGAPADFGDELTAGDRLALVGMLARLHGATGVARRTAPARSPVTAAGQSSRPRSVSWASRGAAAPTASPRAGCWPGTPPVSVARWRASMSWCATPPAAGHR